MSCIHYKFRSALEYDTITFDGLSISLADLKHSIVTQKKFGKNTDFDLEVTNAQTKEEYKDEMTMIPKNSSVVVRRIPIGTKSKAQLAAERASPFSSGEQKTSAFQDYQVPKTHKLSKVADLANADASEEDKLKAMMKQSGEDWDPSQYVRGRRPYAPGVPVPQSYVCYRCGKPGHFIRNCPTNGDTRFDVPKAKRTTGIPRTFLGTTEGTASPPNRVSPSLPDGDSKTKLKEKEISNKKVPSELRCPMCNSLLTDAVLIPCCGTSYCDDCIRNHLLENEQECPSCRTENVSPDSLVINKQLRLAVNNFKNPRPASPFVAAVVKSTTAATNNTEVKSQPATKVVADSASDKPATESKPAAENKVIKDVNDADRKTKESSPKPAQAVKPVPSEPHPIRVHHRDTLSQQGFGLKQGGAPFDPRRRQGEFLPRGAPRVPELHHGLPEPIIPHGLPPEHVPRVPAVRPRMPGPSHPGPRMNVPGYVPGMHAALPAAAIPHIPPIPTLVRPPLSHHPAFGAPLFDPLHPVDVVRSLTPPMSEREFYKMQKKLKTSRNKKTREHEHPPTSFSRESRPRKEPRKDAKKEPKKDGSDFDFDDELFEYRKLQKSRQRQHSRSFTPSRSPSRSRSRSRSRSFSRSRSPSRSSQSPARSPTPEGWDESRSPSPASSRDQTATATASASAEEKKRKHKKRKKEQKGKERKKQKTSHSKEGGVVAEQKDEPVADKGEVKTSEKKKHKRRDKDKANGKETEEEKDKRKDVGKEKDKKEMKVEEKDKEKGKKKEKKKGSDKETGKEKDGKKSKERKKKKKDKDKKDESSSGKKRKSKKKHKKHKRHKKEKSKDGKDEEEKETSDGKIKDSEMGVGSSGDGDHEEKTSTDDEKEEHETQDREDSEQQQGESDGEESESEERISEEESKGDKMDEEETNGSEERQQERMSEEEEKGGKMEKQGKEETNESEDEKLRASGSDEEDEVNQNDIDEEKLLGNESDEHMEPETKLDRSGSAEDKEADVEIDGRKPGKNGSDVEIENGNKVKGDEGGNEEKLLGSQSDKKSDIVNDEILGNETERDGNEEKNIKGEKEKAHESQGEESRNRNDQEKLQVNVVIKTTE